MATANPGFSARLSQELICNGWSKREFAKKVGVHENSLSKYTVRGGVPKWDVLVSMARTLGRSVEWLLSGSEDPLHSVAQLPPQSASSLEAEPIGNERPSTYRLAGIKEQDARSLAAWFARDAEARDILLAWARARAFGQIADAVAEKVEVQAKAMALYILGKYGTTAKLDGTKEPVGEWGPTTMAPKRRRTVKTR
jgi:transcriptional regulator with XRE-family HTH domain